MENDVKLNTGGDSLGEDNADILAAKRRRVAAQQAASAVSATQLRAQMQSHPAVPSKPPVPPKPATSSTAVRQTTAPGASTAARPVAGKPTPPARPAAVAPSVKRPTAVPVKPTETSVKATSAQMKPATAPVKQAGVKPQAPTSVHSTGANRSGEGRPTPGALANRPVPTPAQTSAQMGQTTRLPTVRGQAEKRPEPSALRGGAGGIHTLIPHQQAADPRKNKQNADQTRITDMRAAPPADATRVSAVLAVPQKKKAPPKKREVEDESEGGNAIISVIKAITYIVAVIVVSVFLAVYIILIGNDIYAFVKDESVVEVTVPEYATLNDISLLLHENGVIEYPTVFKVYANLQDDDGTFLAGTYSLTPLMNYDELLAAFKPKKPTGTSRITIPEGYTTDQIIDLLVSKGIGTREGYIDVINNYDFDYWFIDELEANGWKDGRYYRLDGYLFPDTYEFYNASSEEVVIGKLLKRFDQVFVDSYAQKAKELGYTVDELLTLASMIEKEGGTQSDFFNISSVFNNRLKNPTNYPYLESDATIVYAIEHETGEHITPTKEHTAYETPYNTYTHTGLPPGPIANPSASAIRAALYPADTNYYYFYSVSSSVTLYAKTYAEHLENINSSTTPEDVQ